MASRPKLGRFLLGFSVLGGGCGLGCAYSERGLDNEPAVLPLAGLPSRTECWAQLATKGSGSDTEIYDIAVIGGGAVGCGVALDAASRGLKVCLFEKDDFVSHSSSRTSKVLQGGLLSFQAACHSSGWDAWNAVKQAIQERDIALQTAPHLARPFPILVPFDSWLSIPKWWLYTKLYGLMQWGSPLEGSSLLLKEQALKAFPGLDGDKLKAAMLYWEVQHDDARMGLALALTAAHLGACVLNHAQVESLVLGKDSKVEGVMVKDTLTKGKAVPVKAKVVINAAGTMGCDDVLTMANPSHKPYINPTSVPRATLNTTLGSPNMGLLLMSSAGAAVWTVPWMGKTLIGSYQNDAKATAGKDIHHLISPVRSLLQQPQLAPNDVVSVWPSEQPLCASAPKSGGPSHMVTEQDGNGMLTVLGGSYTTYRFVAQEAVDKAMQMAALKARKCVSKSLMLVGGHNYDPTLPMTLCSKYGLEGADAKGLIRRYGDRALEVAQEAGPKGFVKLESEVGILEAEVDQSIREYACTPKDFIIGRSGLAFFDAKLGIAVAPRVTELMGRRLGWNASQKRQQLQSALEELKTFEPPALGQS